VIALDLGGSCMPGVRGFICGRVAMLECVRAVTGGYTREEAVGTVEVCLGF
jgi:hypothetical protein